MKMTKNYHNNNILFVAAIMAAVLVLIIMLAGSTIGITVNVKAAAAVSKLLIHSSTPANLR